MFRVRASWGQVSSGFLSPHFIVAFWLVSSLYFFFFCWFWWLVAVRTFKNESSSEMMIKCFKTHPSFDFKVRKSFVTVCNLVSFGLPSALFYLASFINTSVCQIATELRLTGLKSFTKTKREGV